MLYPATKMDRMLHKIPGGDHVAHVIGLLSYTFEQHAAPDEAKRMKEKVIEAVRPIINRLALIPEDANGRSWKSFVSIRKGVDLLDENAAPDIQVTFGHFNAKEERAFMYFKRNGGSPYYPAEGISFGHIHARRYDLDVPTDRGNGRPIFRGYLPKENDANTLSRQSSHGIDRFASYILDVAVPRIMAFSEPEPRAEAKVAPQPRVL